MNLGGDIVNTIACAKVSELQVKQTWALTIRQNKQPMPKQVPNPYNLYKRYKRL